MLKVDLERWHHSPESLREQALRANQARTRERFLALDEITQGKSATQVGRQTRRNPQTIMDWVHQLQGWLDDALHEQCLLVYIDEAHIHLDTDAGYGWSIRGQRFWVSSSSPGRAKV
jgi:hypothetical protein